MTDSKSILLNTMKRIILPILMLPILLMGCSSKKTKDSPRHYFIVIEDLYARNTFDSVRFPEQTVITAESDSAAVSEAVRNAVTLLFSESYVANLSPNAITKRQPHDFIINIFRDDNSLVEQSVIKDYQAIFDRMEQVHWKDSDQRHKDYKYYKENVPMFTADDIIDRGKDYAPGHISKFAPASKIQQAGGASKSQPESSEHTSIFKYLLLILGFVIICLIFSRMANKSENKQSQTYRHKITSDDRPTPPVSVVMLNRDGDTYEDEWHTYIAGVSYHCSENDIGGYSGYVMLDEDNLKDKRARGIYSQTKLLGYIPANELIDYIDWSDGRPCPCVGFIFIEDGQLRGRVKILRPCNQDFLKTEFNSYLTWVRKNYGDKYVPSNCNWDITE